MKVFWQQRQALDNTEQTLSSSFERIELPAHIYTSLQDTLTSNSSLLPTSARGFQDWNVSLLERFEEQGSNKPRNAIDALYE
jgi:hypothetical protein